MYAVLFYLIRIIFSQFNIKNTTLLITCFLESTSVLPTAAVLEFWLHSLARIAGFVRCLKVNVGQLQIYFV